jgi:hypothetical protein
MMEKALEQAEAFSGLRLALIITFASIFIISCLGISPVTQPLFLSWQLFRLD